MPVETYDREAPLKRAHQCGRRDSTVRRRWL